MHVDNGYNIVGMVAADEAMRSVPILLELGQQVNRLNEAAATAALNEEPVAVTIPNDRARPRTLR